MSSDKKKVMIYIDDKLKRDLERLAEKRFMSMSSLVVSLIDKEIKQAKKDKEIK